MCFASGRLSTHSFRYQKLSDKRWTTRIPDANCSRTTDKKRTKAKKTNEKLNTNTFDLYFFATKSSLTDMNENTKLFPNYAICQTANKDYFIAHYFLTSNQFILNWAHYIWFSESESERYLKPLCRFVYELFDMHLYRPNELSVGALSFGRSWRLKCCIGKYSQWPHPV